MTDNMPDELEDDKGMKNALEAAMDDEHPQESPEKDPFATDALGHEPAEEEFGK